MRSVLRLSVVCRVVQVHEELLGRRNGKYEYTVNIMPHLKLSSYSVGQS